MPGLDSVVGDHERILVRQNKEWGEILIGFESKNKFEISDDQGNPIGLAAEQGGGFGAMLGRQFFGHCRKATIHIYDRAGNAVGRGEKPFRWFFQRMEVFDGDQRIGAIERKFTWLTRRLVVENAAGEEIMEIAGPMLLLGRGTFRLTFQGQEVGKISKQWGGVLREMFTDADTFGVEWASHVPQEIRKILLVATFLIDFTYFENNNRD
ncbi:MAG: phospholipid scramblase-related protein [Planctomycetota bacterium]|nr:phospholipid scramblase-related protein [Planctomycetota bacterium]MEC9046606.1 phospholipid scramblase-related protein [Planctomycetota bacterium]